MKENTLKNLAVTLKTPAFIFDLDILKERIQWVTEVIRPAKLCYAIKANPFLIGEMDAYVERYEVCSPGEFHICVKEHLPMEKIVLSGVFKEEEDVRYAMEQGVMHRSEERRVGKECRL